MFNNHTILVHMKRAKKTKTYNVGPIQNCESVSCNPDGGNSRGPLALGGVRVLVVTLLGNHVEIVGAILQIGSPVNYINVK